MGRQVRILQICRQIDTKTNRRTDRQTDKHTYRQVGRYIDRKVGRQTAYIVHYITLHYIHDISLHQHFCWTYVFTYTDTYTFPNTISIHWVTFHHLLPYIIFFSITVLTFLQITFHFMPFLLRPKCRISWKHLSRIWDNDGFC